MLVDQRNAPHLLAWVKCPDTGFYTIPCLRTSGSKRGERVSFNPDFLLQVAGDQRPRILVVETKADNDATDENADKVRAGEAHVVKLNGVESRVADYSFHLIAPADLLDFFAELRQGAAHEFAGGLHAELRDRPIPGEAAEPGETAGLLEGIGDGPWEDITGDTGA
jgi:hypothetical protein